MDYRRAYVPGGSYFFTVVTEKRRHLLTGSNIEAVRSAFKRVRAAHPFHMEAIVVLPDHLHCLWTLPDGDADYSTRWRLIKTHVSRNVHERTVLPVSESRRSKKMRGIWQHRFWEHVIRDERDFEHHLDYIHYNPVRHGYVERPADWPHSSFHAYVRRGFYDINWGATTSRDNPTNGRGSPHRHAHRTHHP